MSKEHPTATIQTTNGDVYTGSVVNTKDAFVDTAFNILTGGLGAVAETLSSEPRDVTVKVNGTNHTGNRI